MKLFAVLICFLCGDMFLAMAQDEVAIAGPNFSDLQLISKNIRIDCKPGGSRSATPECKVLFGFFDRFDTEFVDALKDNKIIGIAFISEVPGKAKPGTLHSDRIVTLPKEVNCRYQVRLETPSGNHIYDVSYDQAMFLEIFRQLCASADDAKDLRAKFEHELADYVQFDSCLHAVASSEGDKSQSSGGEKK